MKLLIGTLVVLLAACATSQTVPAQTSRYQDLDQKSCEILTRGNTVYVSGNLRQAIETFKNIEDIDRVGHGACTASVYATMGTSWALLANAALSNNPQTAALNYKRAAFYNRAFAYALACKSGDCDPAAKFWAPDSLAFWGSQ